MMLWPCSNSYGIPLYAATPFCKPKNQLQHHVHHQQDHLYWHLTRSEGATKIPVVDQIKRKSWVPLGVYPRYIPTYTTYIWILYWLYRPIWGNVWGTTATVPSQGYPIFPFDQSDRISGNLGMVHNQLIYTLYSGVFIGYIPF